MSYPGYLLRELKWSSPPATLSTIAMAIRGVPAVWIGGTSQVPLYEAPHLIERSICLFRRAA